MSILLANFGGTSGGANDVVQWPFARWNAAIMSTFGNWVFLAGLGLMLPLGLILARRFRREYRTLHRPSYITIGILKVFFGIDLTLVVLAGVNSSWHFSLPAPLPIVFGTMLTAIGVVLGVAAVYAYGGSWKRASGLDTSRLVTEGIHHWTRNPMLIGSALVLVGVGVIRESAMLLFVTAVLFVSIHLYLPLEEELLGSLYGEAYEEYRRSTPRYLGRRKPLDRAAALESR